MFLLILLFPITLLACWILPILGTLYSKSQTQKWIIFWLLSMILSYTLYPMLEYFIDCEYVMITQIFVTLALMFLLNHQKVKVIIGHVDTVVEIGKGQFKTVKDQVKKTAEQFGLIEPKA